MFHCLNHRLVVFYILFTSLSLFTMDAQPKITLKKIKGISNPAFIVALRNGKAAIANRDSCNIINLKNNNIITKIPLPNIERLITNRKRTLLGIDTSDNCFLYCVEQRQFLWKTPIDSFSPSTFTADNTLWSFNQENGSLINSRGGKYTNCPKNLDQDVCSHPTEKKIFCSQGVYNEEDNTYQNSLYVITMRKKNHSKVNQIILPKKISPNRLGNGILIKDHSALKNILTLYSPIDGGWSLYDYVKNEIVLDLSGYNNLALHPTKYIAAMITQGGDLMLYNIEKNKILARIALPRIPYPSTTPINQTTMDFSSDGKTLIFMLASKCYQASIAPTVFDQ